MVLLVKSVVLRIAPGSSHLLMLMCELAAAALFCAAFVLFMPHRPLRALVHEMTIDFLPDTMRRTRWVRAYLQMQEAAQPSST